MPKRARNKRRPRVSTESSGHAFSGRTLSGWGGRRAGAGRPRLRARHQASEPHLPRPSITIGRPILVVARFVDGLRFDIGADRRRRIANDQRRPTDIDRAVARALSLAHERGDFRILDVQVRRDAIHLVIEATDKLALARGMQGFQVSAARGINRAARRSGSVFADRYRARPRAAK